MSDASAGPSTFRRSVPTKTSTVLCSTSLVCPHTPSMRASRVSTCPARPHQKLKELKFPQRELDLATPAHHLMGGGVERQVKYAQRRSARHGSPSRENTDPRKKLGE